MAGDVTDTGGAGFYSFGVDLGGDFNAKIHDNVIISGVTSASSDTASVAVRLNGMTNSNSEVRNNTLVSRGSAVASIALRQTNTGSIKAGNNIMVTNNSAANFCVDVGIYASTVTEFLNNDFKGCTGSTTDGGDKAMIRRTSGDVDTEADANDATATGFAATSNNVTVDPLFADQAGLDFHLSTNSPVKTTGINGKTAMWDFNGIFTDADGQPRNTTWSMGAYQ